MNLVGKFGIINICKWNDLLQLSLIRFNIENEQWTRMIWGLCGRFVYTRKTLAEPLLWLNSEMVNEMIPCTSHRRTNKKLRQTAPTLVRLFSNINDLHLPNNCIIIRIHFARTLQIYSQNGNNNKTCASVRDVNGDEPNDNNRSICLTKLWLVYA